MGSIAKGQKLKIIGEYPAGFSFDGLSGVWSKEIFNPKPVKCKSFSDGYHDYLIPVDLYKEHEDFIKNLDEESADDCSNFDDIFGKYRIDGSTQLFRYE
jgi:hypothetical protein